MGYQLHGPAALPPGKTRFTLYKRLGGLQCWYGQARKFWLPSPTGIRSLDRFAIPTALSRPTLMEPYITLTIHSAVCLTTGSLPLPHSVLHIVRSGASSFKFQYPLLQIFQELLTSSCHFCPSAYHVYPSVYHFYHSAYHFHPFVYVSFIIVF